MATDSGWGYASQTLTDPAPPGSSTPRSDSGWGTATVVLVDPTPAPTTRDSGWGFAAVTLSTPHHPITVLTPDGIAHVPILTRHGSSLR